MSDLQQKLKQLSPEKRALLLKKLQLKEKIKKQTLVIPKRANVDELPMSEAQKRLWFLQQLEPNSPFYNIPAAIQMKGKIVVHVLQQAINKVVERHEILRASYSVSQNQPVQNICSMLDVSIGIIDISEHPQLKQEELIHDLANKEAQIPFDLSLGSLIRASLIRLDDSDHVLLFTLHHIVADGWSVPILINEMALLYQSILDKTTSPLVELDIQYPDYAAWHKNWLQEYIEENQLQFWKIKLEGMPGLLELPYDKPRPPVQTYSGQHFYFEIPSKLAAPLKELAAKESVTPFIAFLTAYQLLLHRISGQDEFGVGIPVANRSQTQVQKLIGFFVNTLVVRADLSQNISFRDLLRKVKDFTLSAFENQELPFERLVEELAPNREVSQSPLFQVLFDFQTSPFQEFKFNDLTFSLIDIENQTSKFDLLLLLEDSQSSIKGTFEYNTDLFLHESIQRFTQNFLTLLESISKNCDTPISQLAILSENDEKSLSKWEKTETLFPSNKCVHELFEEQVEINPDAIAVQCGESKLTFFELNIKANQVANFLRKMDVRPESYVGVRIERSIETISSILGIIKSGAVYVPLDPSYPKERIEWMLRDTQAKIIITTENIKDSLPQNVAKLICIDSDWETINNESDKNPVNLVCPDNLIYVIYTSGSTGRPKGVRVTHKNVVRLVKNTSYAKLDSNQVFLQLAPIAFDASTLEIWGSLLNGAKLAIVSSEKPSLSEISDAINKYDVTALWLTAGLFHAMLDEELDALLHVDQLLAGGDVLSVPHVRKLLEHSEENVLINGYGPTENTTFTCCYSMNKDSKILKSVPIGRPISNTQTYILDKNLQQVPIGVSGELLIGGSGLARDYLNRPSLTAEKFIPNPFSKKPGTRLYKTGDLVRYLDDGTIEFLGRFDDQVKIRGFRIELGEIENILSGHHEIKDCAVVVHENLAHEKLLVAYLVSENSIFPSRDDLRNYLLQKLPEYMVPSVFMELDVLPISPNGKVDRKAMPVPDQARTDLEKTYIPPKTEVEKYLVNIWQDILGIKKIGIYDNFFELGGNSIQAAVLANRLQKEFNVTIQVRSVFLAPTVSEFSMYIDEYYSDLVLEKFGSDDISSVKLNEKIQISDDIGKIDNKKLNQFRKLIIPLPSRSVIQPEMRNKPAIFILSPPRSGSTLLRVMLAGNPNLFSPPELELLSFNTLQERKKELSKQYGLWLEATFRAIMELKNCSVDEAEKIMENLESLDVSVKEFYATLQEWMGDKILVDKTPTYPLDPNILDRAETDFVNTKYIHLARHPYASIYSFMEAKLDQNFFRQEHTFNRRELAELIWIVCHQNIQSFLQTIPNDRKYLIRFEDLISEPEYKLRELCEFLDIDFHSDMLKPYEGKRMTKPVKENSQMVGDFKFYLRKRIESDVIDRWKKFHTAEFLSNIAWDIAQSYNYQREIEDITKTASDKSGRHQLTELHPASRDGNLQLSFAQQRLWFLDRLEPESAFYNISSAFNLSGQINEEALFASINEIFRRHEILRTAFNTVEGKANLEILSTVNFVPQIVDLSILPEKDKDEELLKLSNIEANRPFDLSQVPLMRVTLIKLKFHEHVLIINMHHIISDGWSNGIFIKELAAFYEAHVKNEPLQLPDLPIQYIDFSHWQREWLKGDILENQLNYWEKKLENIHDRLELPTDFKRPAVQRHHGERIYFEIKPEVYKQLISVSNEENSTLFILLLTVFNTFLMKYSGQEDICIGTPVSGRNRSEIEPLIGFFVNTLVLRNNLSGNPTIRELLKQVNKTAIDAYANQDVPFEKLVDLIQPQREMSYTPMFQVMFAFIRSELETIGLHNLEIKPIKLRNVTSKFDLTLEILERKNCLKAAIEFNTDLFKVSTIDRMIANFQVLLEKIIANLDVKLSNITLLSDLEQKQIVNTWNDNSIEGPIHSTFTALFEQQVVKTPDEIAVVYRQEKLTYYELNQKSNQLAYYLRKMEIGPESLVCICLDRSVEVLVTIIGVLKSGAAYVPLDPTYPKDRLSFILNDSKASVLLTQINLLKDIPDSATQIIYLDKDWENFAGESRENPQNQTIPENSAYVIYTSGSTGIPKGVMVTHKAMLHLYGALKHKIYSLFPGKKFTASLNAPIPFDASVQQLVLLLDGHTLDIIPHEVRTNGESFLQFINEHNVDVLDCVPSQLKLLLDNGFLDKKSEGKPVICLPGGEAIDELTWNDLVQSEQTQFFNMYGPTECAVDSTIHHINSSKTGPTIGSPVANAHIFILDKYLQPVPIGVVGEIFISGTGVSRGYLNRPGLTAQRFLPNPFTTSNGERFYKTGDLGKYLENGNIEYIGRSDFQVKLRGFRIELEEIEAVLREHLVIKDDVVLVREDAPGEKRLVGYLVIQLEHERPTVTDLREFLQQKLPEYMIPSVFVFLDEFPLTPNGKVNRKALPEPDQDRPVLMAEYIAPQTEKEIALTEIWKVVLNLEKVGIKDNFFELGGDSILSIQVVSKANHAGYQLTPKQMFLHPTIEGLVSVAGTGPQVHAEQNPVTGIIPLTPVQKRFFEQNLQNPNHWNQSILLEVSSELRADLLPKVVLKLHEHHDMLRVHYRKTCNNWEQYIAEDDHETSFTEIDLTAYSEEEKQTKLKVDISNCQQQMNLENGPLFAVSYFKMGDKLPARLFIVAHHLIIDGVSWRILLQDFYTVYKQLKENVKVHLPAKTTSFKYWAEKLLEYSQSDSVHDELNYWKSLAEETFCPISVDFEEGLNDEESVEMFSVSYDSDMTKTLLTEAQKPYNTTIDEFLLTAFLRAYSRWSGKRSLLLDMEGHGRENLFKDVDVSRTIGWFTNIYPVYLNLGKSISPIESLKEIKEQCRAIPSKGMSFGMLRYLDPSQKNISTLEQIKSEISFNYLGQFDHKESEESELKPARESVGLERGLKNERDFSIDISASVRDKKMCVSWSYSRNIHINSTITLLATYFEEELRLLIEACTSSSKGEYTRSDFVEADLQDEAEFEGLMAEIEENLEQ